MTKVTAAVSEAIEESVTAPTRRLIREGLASVEPLPPLADAALGMATRLDFREKAALNQAVLWQGHNCLPRPHVREKLRDWFYDRRGYLLGFYRGVMDEHRRRGRAEESAEQDRQLGLAQTTFAYRRGYVAGRAAQEAYDLDQATSMVRGMARLRAVGDNAAKRGGQ
jgi:hypothetical protein